MRAGVARQVNRLAWRDGGKLRFGREHKRCAKQARKNEQQTTGGTHHQSSLTARTASMETARRPARTAVVHDDASITSASTDSSVHGTCSDMLQ
jgi:hypothetical protein